MSALKNDTCSGEQARRRNFIVVLLLLAVLLIGLLASTLLGGESVPLDERRMVAMVGGLDVRRDGLAIRLDPNGAALLRFDLRGVDPAQTPYFRIALGGDGALRKLLFFARSPASPEPFTLGVAEGADIQEGAAPYFGRDGRWTSTVVELFVGLEGRANADIKINDASLLAGTPRAWLANFQWSLSRPEPWSLRSINVAVARDADLVKLRPASALSLVVAGVGILALVVARLLRVAILPLVAGLFLLAWIFMDTSWFGQQLYNVRAALGVAAGDEERASPLAPRITSLDQFVQRVGEALPAGASQRILVGSADEFSGMRAAYRLYPRNVFWERGRELPAPEFLRKGDHLLVLRPSRHSVQDGRLRHPDWSRPGPRVSVKLSDPLGLLLMVR